MPVRREEPTTVGSALTFEKPFGNSLKPIGRVFVLAQIFGRRTRNGLAIGQLPGQIIEICLATTVIDSHHNDLAGGFMSSSGFGFFIGSMFAGNKRKASNTHQNQYAENYNADCFGKISTRPAAVPEPFAARDAMIWSMLGHATQKALTLLIGLRHCLSIEMLKNHLIIP
jgi:hypothetical protein